MILQLADVSQLGILQTILDGGLPLALIIGVYVVFMLYKKEKEAKDVEVNKRVEVVEAHAAAIGTLRSDYSKKVEELLRERIASETASQKILIENKEVMQSVVMQMSTIGDLIEAAEREAN